MRVVCVYRDKQDYTRSVEEWIENLRRQTGREIETMDPDKNPSFCETYDIVEYPTMLAIDTDGSLLQMWRGTDMPRISDVSYYLMEH